MKKSRQNKKNKNFYHRKDNGKDLINFDKLSPGELDELSQKWEREARIFEARFETFRSRMDSDDPYDQKKEFRLWGSGKGVWQRLRTLETYRKNRGLL